jgi:uncharacterized protein (DUF736 family)
VLQHDFLASVMIQMMEQNQDLVVSDYVVTLRVNIDVDLINQKTTHNVSSTNIPLVPKHE